MERKLAKGTPVVVVNKESSMYQAPGTITYVHRKESGKLAPIPYNVKFSDGREMRFNKNELLAYIPQEEEQQRDKGVLQRANARIAEETKNIPSDDTVRFEEVVTKIYREEEADGENS